VGLVFTNESVVTRNRVTIVVSFEVNVNKVIMRKWRIARMTKNKVLMLIGCVVYAIVFSIVLGMTFGLYVCI